MEDNQFHRAVEVKKRGKLIAVCSAKGGIGRTTLAVNLAVAMNKKNINVCVVDGDFQFGDVGLALDLKATFSIKDAAEEYQTLDEHSLSNYVSKHESGITILSAPDRPEHADLISEEALNKILDLLVEQNEYVIVDTSVGLQEKTLQIIERADKILVVTTLEMTALKNTKLLLETLETLNVREKATLVINRSTMESVIKANDVPSILGVEEPFYIPNNFQLSSQALNMGIPIVINHGSTDLARSIFKMAEQLLSTQVVSTKRGKNSSILTKLFKNKGRKGASDQ